MRHSSHRTAAITTIMLVLTAHTVFAVEDAVHPSELSLERIFKDKEFRVERYGPARWLEDGSAYHCYCSKSDLEELRAAQMERGEKTRYDGRCRSRTEPKQGVDPVVRFKNPLDGSVVVQDKVRGEVIFQNAELDDLIIARSDGTPTYNFAVVVDDHDMQITHVIRGDDHLNNTPKQMNMLSALGAAIPEYAHLPMILGADGAKLSKRHGAVDIRDYRDSGYLPEAMLNYLVRLGWSHGDQEIFSIDQMIELFDVADVNQSASAFNPEKLEWINQQHIISAAADRIADALPPYFLAAGIDIQNGPSLQAIADAYRERATTLVQMVESSRYCFEDFDEIDAAAAKKNLRPVIQAPLQCARDRLAELDNWDTSEIAKTIEGVANEFEIKMGKLGQPIRVAVTGGSVSPPIDATVWLVGKDRVISRLDAALKFIQIRAESS